MVKKESKEPIIFDCQLFQTFSWQRGMGKYSLELIRSLMRNNSSSEHYFLFNNNAPANNEAKELLTREFNAKFIDIDLDLPKEPREEYSAEPVRQHNKQKLNEFIRKSFGANKPTFFILSIYLDEVVSVFPDKELVKDNVAIYYDSIPFLYHERYGRYKGFFENYYMPHTATVFDADKLLTISKTVANDLHLYFGIQKERIFNIDGASIPRNTDKPSKPKNFKYQAKNYILMPSGQELRKNNNRAVEAFESFNKRHDDKYTLLITSHFTEDGRNDLKQISSHVDFTGNVDESELIWLYRNCLFVLFASEYEGLGLPVLEAVDENKLVACSDISVFKEMSDTFTFFDPTSTQAIEDALERTLERVDSGYEDKEAYDAIKRKYTWKNTAERCKSALNAVLDLPVVKKKKIAVFSPDPSGFSAIGKDIGELHAWYSTYFEVDYYFDKGPNHRILRPNFLTNITDCKEASEFTEEDYKGYDAVVYHVGNSEYHINIVRNALVFPGIVILHDTDLSGLYNNLLEMGYISPDRVTAESILEKKISKGKKHSDRSTFISSIINNQKAVVVHSEYAKTAVAAKIISKNTPVQYSELPFDTPVFSEVLPDRSRKDLSIAFAGIIAKIKGIDIIESVAVSPDFAGVRINIFGFSAGHNEQLDRLSELPNVNVVRNPSDFEFQTLLAASDIMVNVRMAYRGETSGSTLSHMRYGGIGVVRNFGWFDELPDNAVAKVEEPEETFMVLRNLISDHNLRAKMSKSALSYMDVQHSHKKYAEDMYVLIEKVNNKRS